jgi:hypothetical protein
MPSHEPSDALPSPPAGGPGARPAALLAVRISPADVGRRVTVRHRYDATTLTDVVGRLLAWDDGPEPTLRVERRDGSVTVVPLGLVVAAKVVPEAPPRR